MHVDTAFACYDAGLHQQAGGDGSEVCSGELLLESLVACAGVTFNVVATATGVTFRSVQLVVEDEGDFRGTLGLAKAYRWASPTSACVSTWTATPPTSRYPRYGTAPHHAKLHFTAGSVTNSITCVPAPPCGCVAGRSLTRLA